MYSFLLNFYSFCPWPIFFFFYLLICRKRGKERKSEKERHTDLLFHLFMHSLVDSCMCPDQGFEPTTLAYWDDTLTN